MKSYRLDFRAFYFTFFYIGLMRLRDTIQYLKYIRE